MDKKETIEQIVSDLKKTTGQEEPVRILQEIGELLLTKYIIKIKDIVIEPLWVEAYYFNPDKGFKDPFVYCEDEQKEFGSLFFHHKTDDQRSGVDICLSLSNDEGKSSDAYYLSFLLKYTLVNGEFTTQSQLSGKIRKAYEELSESEKKEVLKEYTTEVEAIACTERIGLKDNNNAERRIYSNMKLAIVRDFHKVYMVQKSLPKKEKLVDEYLRNHEVEKEKWCNSHLNYCPKKYKGK